MKHDEASGTSDTIEQSSYSAPDEALYAELSRRTFLFSLGALALSGCGMDVGSPLGTGPADGARTASLLAGTSGFVHPGLLHTQADFDRMAAKYTTAPWSGSWNS